MRRDLDRTDAADLRCSHRRRRHLRADDRLRLRATRLVCRLDRAARLRQRGVLQPPSNDPWRVAVSADARLVARARIGQRTPNGRTNRARRGSTGSFHPSAVAIGHPGLARSAGRVSSRSMISRRRNDNVPESLRLPAGHIVAGAEVPDEFLGSRTRSASAAAWYDYITTDADRLTLSWGIAAANYGAVLANYLEATELIVEGGRAIGVRAIDRLANRGLDIAARLVINATGGAVDRLLGASGLASGVPMLKAMNLVTNRTPPRGGNRRTSCRQGARCLPCPGRAAPCSGRGNRPNRVSRRHVD